MYLNCSINRRFKDVIQGFWTLICYNSLSKTFSNTKYVDGMRKIENPGRNVYQVSINKDEVERE